jgi:hypothetical protein
MAVVSDLSPISLTQFFYQSGKIVRPARLFFYKPGTEDRVTVYTDAGLGTPYDQPLLTGGSGRVPPVYIGTEPYRVRVFDSYGALIEDIDYLPGATAATSGGSSGSVLTPAEKLQLLQTGDFVIQFTKGGRRDGFVRANGGLIGPGGFTGAGFPDIERQNNDCYALFVHLWGQDTLGTLAVLPSKGATADDDWYSLAKVIRLPDLRGRALMGIDGPVVSASATPSNALAAVTFQWGNSVSPGSYAGTAVSVITAAQLPTHTHTITGVGTGITIAASPTSIAIAGSPTGISIAGAIANLQYAATGVYTGGAYTGIGIYANYTGGYISDPGHSHSYNAFQAGAGYIYGVTSTGDGNFVAPATSHNTTGVSFIDPTHAHSVYDPTHAHAIGDPTHIHGQSAHVHGVSDPWHAHSVSDPWHAHTLTDPTHTHAIGSTGSSAAFQTIDPFSLATVYIKL